MKADNCPSTAPAGQERDLLTAAESRDDGLVGAGRIGQGPNGRRRRSTGRSWLLISAIAVALVASGAVGGYLQWKHYAAERQRALAAEFNAAARQGVVNLMSVDFNDAESNVRRLVDNSTGSFKDELRTAAEPLARSLMESKVTTTVTVNSTAVESMSADSGVVLVAASTEVRAADSGDRKPAQWRISVTLSRDAGQLKISRVDFVR